jgi:hypothetical protein
MNQTCPQYDLISFFNLKILLLLFPSLPKPTPFLHSRIIILKNKILPHVSPVGATEDKPNLLVGILDIGGSL